MSIKILGGMAKGYSLKVFDSSELRPTSIMLRRKLFDWKQNWDQHCFVDLCAGTGMMGVEAWSRGAQDVHFNELNSKHYKLLKDNLDIIQTKFKLDGHIHLTQMPFIKMMNQFLNDYFQRPVINQQMTTLFFDPPYEKHELYFEFMKLMKSIEFLGQIWIESDQQKGLNQHQIESNFKSPTKIFEQGSSFIIIC
jgi:16S rRNA (guanine966-N2)-methyltransferase